MSSTSSGFMKGKFWKGRLVKCCPARKWKRFSIWRCTEMDTLREVFDPHFILRNSVYISIAFGVTCPLVGVYLVLRRLVFMGVALPQISSCGIAFAFALQGWGLLPHIHESAQEQTLAFLGSTVFTLAAILLLSLLARRGHGSVEARVGTAYALAGAWSVLLLVQNPAGEHGLLDLLEGEILAGSAFELRVAIGGMTALIGFCIAYRWDMPVGATDVALLGAIYTVAFVVSRLIGRRRVAGLV